MASGRLYLALGIDIKVIQHQVQLLNQYRMKEQPKYTQVERAAEIGYAKKLIQGEAHYLSLEL